MTEQGFNFGGKKLNKKASNLRTFVEQWDSYVQGEQEEVRNFVSLNKFNQSDADYVMASFNMDRRLSDPDRRGGIR